MPFEMTIDRRIILFSLALLTIAISFLVGRTDASRYHLEDGNNQRHRHRHRHDTSVGSGRRNHEIVTSRRGPAGWSKNEDDYEDALDAEEDVSEQDDEDYEIDRGRGYYERSYQASRNSARNHHSRYEPRFPSRNHHASVHHENSWYRGGSAGNSGEEDAVGRRNSRYDVAGSSRGHRSRPGRERTYHDDRRVPIAGYPSRIHDSNDSGDDLDREIGYERTARRWRFDDEIDDDSPDYRASRWRNSPRYRGRSENRRNDWKPNGFVSSASSAVSSASQRNDEIDRTGRRRKIGPNYRGAKRPGRQPFDDSPSDDNEDDRNDSLGSWTDKRSRNNLIGPASPVDRRKDNEDDYDDSNENDEPKESKKRYEDDEDDNEDEEDSIWNDADDDPEDEDDNFDNTNYYKTEDEPPYKTFDDIIKSLTSDDPTTSKPSIRREYRNTGVENYLKRDAYGNIYDSRNISITKISHDVPYNERSNNLTSNKWRYHEEKPVITSTKKISNSIADERRRLDKKLDDAITRTKSLEQEYDEDYENNETDVVKRGHSHGTEMQADINNTEYADEDNETETEHETSVPWVESTTTTSTTTTSTTTTTPKPVTANPSTRNLQPKSLQPQSVDGAHKWQSLNSRDNTKDTKSHAQQNNNKNGKSAEIKEALQHAIKVSREGSCQFPRPRILPVRDVYPSPSTTYFPHCAILHRCSDDTGCCRSEALTCVPKVSHRVVLYFYTTSIGGASVVEKLSFYNHTECECKERSEYGTSVDKTSGTNEHRFTRHHPPAVSPPQNIRRPLPRKPCRCPSEFTPRITPEGDCQCNCFENDQNCIRTRRGKGYFSLRDRLCIQNEECATPSCEFGEYMRRQGKCPRKKDKFDAIANHPSNINLHHRFRS